MKDPSKQIINLLTSLTWKRNYLAHLRGQQLSTNLRRSLGLLPKQFITIFSLSNWDQHHHSFCIKTRDWFHRQISEFLYRQCWSKALLLVNVSWLLTSNHNALFQFYATLKIFMIFAPNLKINVNPELFVIVGCT